MTKLTISKQLLVFIKYMYRQIHGRYIPESWSTASKIKTNGSAVEAWPSRWAKSFTRPLNS